VRILGIDCGSQITGFGVIETDGVTHRLLEAGAIKTNPRDSFAGRLLRIGSAIREVIARHQPDEAAVEDAFYSANVRSALRLSQVRGVALFVVAEAGITVEEYPPAVVKGSIVGHGRAEKEQVQFMLRSLLKLESPIESLDASDAVAVAICHAVRRPAGVK
jgi:crossover junction endodeoxyribonuclease RuvC